MTGKTGVTLLLAFVLATAATGAFAGSKLPDGFSAASFPKFLTFTEAKAFCESKGARLPKINRSANWDGKNSDSATVDGFGRFGNPWPKGLRGGDYWTETGTAGSRYPADHVWVVRKLTGEMVGHAAQETGRLKDFRVICVPK